MTQGTTLLLTNVYDASGRVAEEQQSGCSAMHDYAFDPWGQRELDLWGWWNPCGFDALEWIGLPGGSQAFYNENNTRGTYFTHLDSLGTATAMTDQSGGLWGQDRYYPFGQMWMAGGWMATGQRYAGTEHRDPLGMDATQFRAYASTYGRWMTPDPLGGDITNPQSLNRYTYALNNPCTLADPMGLSPCDLKKATNAKVINFINANIGAVQPVANQLNLPVQNILGLAGGETNYGTNSQSRLYGNYFNANLGPTVPSHLPPFATGHTPTTINGNYYASFTGSTNYGMVPSLNWFQAVYGKAVTGQSSPNAFVDSLIEAGFNTAEAKFRPTVLGGIGAIALRLDCPSVNKSGPGGSPAGGSIVPTGGGGGIGGGGNGSLFGVGGAGPGGGFDWSWLPVITSVTHVFHY